MGLGAQVTAFGLAYGDGPHAAGPAAARQDPYGRRGPYQVGFTTLETGDHLSTAARTWYPAAAAASPAPSIAYSLAIQLGEPMGSVVLSTYVGSASRDAPADRTIGPRPLVLLSPGFAIGSGAYAWLAEHLASHGFVVVALHHGEVLDPDGLWRATVDRPADVLAVLAALDTSPPGRLSGLVDLESVAVIGHSYGGYTALASAGAGLDTAGFETTCDNAAAGADPVTFLCDALRPHLADMASRAGIGTVPTTLWPSLGSARVDAVVALAGDGVMFAGRGLGDVRVPVLTVGGTADQDAPFRWGTQLAFEQTTGPRRVEVGLIGAEHLVFTGPCERSRRLLVLVPTPFCVDPAWPKADAHALVRSFVTAFLRAELTGDPGAQSWLSSPAGLPSNVTYRSEGY